jgi:hypothetical protein
MWPFNSKQKQIDKALAALNLAIGASDADKEAAFAAAFVLVDALAELDPVVIARMQLAQWLVQQGRATEAPAHVMCVAEIFAQALAQPDTVQQAAKRLAREAAALCALPDAAIAGEPAAHLALSALYAADKLSHVTLTTRDGKIEGAPAFDNGARLALYDLAIRAFQGGAPEPAPGTIAETHAHRADTLMSLDRAADAEASYWRARNLFAKTFGDKHDVIAQMDHKLARALLAQDRDDEALAAWDRAYQHVRSADAPHPRLLGMLMGYGQVLERRTDDASRARAGELAALFAAAKAGGAIELLG